MSMNKEEARAHLDRARAMRTGGPHQNATKGIGAVKADFTDDRVLLMPELRSVLGGVTSHTIFAWERAGRIKLLRLNPRVVGCRAGEVRRFLKAAEAADEESDEVAA